MTLDDIRMRCHVDEDGCWHWQRAMRKNLPVVRIEDNRQRSTRLFVWTLLGKTATKNMHPYPTCGHVDCVAPSHLKLKPKGALVAQSCSRGVVRRILNFRSMQYRAKLSMDAARKIRARAGEGIPQRAIAKEFGVSQTVVGRVVNNEAWREVTPFSL